MILCADLGDITEIFVWEFGVEEVEGCMSCMEDKCLLSVIDRGGILPGTGCIRYCRNLYDILGRAFQRIFELHGENRRSCCVSCVWPGISILKGKRITSMDKTGGIFKLCVEQREIPPSFTIWGILKPNLADILWLFLTGQRQRTTEVILH
jgi:hypothetical protein